VSAPSLQELGELLRAASEDRLTLAKAERLLDPSTAILKEALCLAITALAVRDYAAINPRGHVRRALQHADGVLRRFA
jgi:hypothetical protein